MAWWHSRPFHFSTHPFRCVIHRPLSGNHKAFRYRSLRSSIAPFSPPIYSDFFLGQESLFHPIYPFQQLWTDRQSKPKISTTPLQSSRVSSIDDWLWRLSGRICVELSARECLTLEGDIREPVDRPRRKLAIQQPPSEQ
ncbi:hypothetical protein AVEN_151635-1 [Araneus ventricosus]|uniref:Uncharacterized protein n=1 Tax=Araneus ventricosus TaxID=182803 RepID=A0A4Y1ZPD5_ARAVE|nr:hypothetical protein AVEN_97697-1 [Araneus ventricosus]GBL60692.1 hypothetical protein AVEN_190737-1 [Araneus ventricosus]GBL60698.1 hypothetical protein AVEN_248160-1 [Araneus ventricosus]GBL60730.1 hypothetical protein AVEN_151635-1 [Araneus ventricosus]